jgi:hypothetical protein
MRNLMATRTAMAEMTATTGSIGEGAGARPLLDARMGESVREEAALRDPLSWTHAVGDVESSQVGCLAGGMER